MALNNITSEKYVYCFDSLFSRWQDNYFCGSKEQARLLMQIMTNRFISTEYLKYTFASFINAGLVEDTGRVACIALEIGPYKFRPTDQAVYRRLMPIDREERLQKLLQIFANVEERTDELVQKTDLDYLRKLEESRGRLGNRYNYSDDQWLFEKSRTKIVEVINLLESYDFEAGRQKKRKKITERKLLQNEYEERYIEWVGQVAALIEKSVSIAGVPQIKVRAGSFDGFITPDKIYFKKDGDFVIEGPGLKFIIPLMLEGVGLLAPNTVEIGSNPQHALRGGREGVSFM